MSEITTKASPSHPTLTLAALTHCPEDPLERERIGEGMWVAAHQSFQEKLSPEQLSLWNNPRECFEHDKLVRAFDDSLLELVREFGTTTFFSRQILDRLFKWEQHRPDLLRRLGEELEWHGRIQRGEKRPPLPADLYKFKQGALRELELLFRKARADFSLRRRPPILFEIAEWFLAEIEATPAKFPCLWENKAQLHHFVSRLEATHPATAHTLEEGTMKAAEFLTLWLTAVFGRSAEWIRQAISRRKGYGTRRRTSRR